MNYTLAQIAKITGGKLLGDDITVSNIAIDSRSCNTNAKTIFIALSGSGRDGHSFLGDARNNGIRAFLVQKVEEVDPNISYVVVDDTLSALQMWAKYHRSEFSGEVVAITGSNGKTTTKEWFAQLWRSENGKLMRSPRSYNSQIGVPLSLLQISGDERVAIIEAGISKYGEMTKLQEIIRPTLGVLTNIGDAHSENFNSLSEKLSEKLLLFKDLTPQKIIRGDRVPHSDATTHNRWLVNEIYSLLGLDYNNDMEVLPLSLRLEVQQGVFDSLIINDSYSNDLSSLTSALEFARREATHRPLHLILTDIEQSEVQYSTLSAMLERYDISSLVAIGDNIKELKSSIPTVYFNTTEEFLERLNPSTYSGAAVLIKGARSLRTERISARLEERNHTTTLEVNLSTITDNFKSYKNLLAEKCKTMAMVKASCYGLGSLQICRTLVDVGVDYLAVAFADEGITLRRGGITAPIIVLNSDPGSFRAMVEYNLEPEIYSHSALKNYCNEIKKAGLTHAPIHIKLDTGMHRLGFMESDIEELCRELLSARSWVYVSSIFSHFAASDDPSEDDFTRGQIALLDTLSSKVIDAIGYRPLLSIANTHGTARLPEAHFGMVRLGIGLYLGASTLRSKITQIKTIESGETIGYNRRTTATRPSRIAIIPIGYADGLRRDLGCRVGQVLVGGVLCDIVGSVCMDTAIIDITDAPQSVNEGDSVTVMGAKGITECDIAHKLSTIPYEILTSISSRIKRLWVW